MENQVDLKEPRKADIIVIMDELQNQLNIMDEQTINILEKIYLLKYSVNNKTESTEIDVSVKPPVREGYLGKIFDNLDKFSTLNNRLNDIRISLKDIVG